MISKSPATAKRFPNNETKISLFKKWALQRWDLNGVRKSVYKYKTLLMKEV